MSLTNPTKVITEERLSEFYTQILPYLGGMPDILANKFSKADLYSTDETMVGRWITGKPLYQKVVEFSGQKTIGTSWVDVGVSIPDGETVVYSCGMYGTENPVTWVSAKITSNKLYVTSAGVTSYINKIIIQYTKTTDSSVEIGNDTDYSTTEKIVGTWIDGKPIYQTTFNLSPAKNVQANTWTDIVSSGDASVCIDCKLVANTDIAACGVFCRPYNGNFRIYSSFTIQAIQKMTVWYTKITD